MPNAPANTIIIDLRSWDRRAVGARHRPASHPHEVPRIGWGGELVKIDLRIEVNLEERIIGKFLLYV